MSLSLQIKFRIGIMGQKYQNVENSMIYLSTAFFKNSVKPMRGNLTKGHVESQKFVKFTLKSSLLC